MLICTRNLAIQGFKLIKITHECFNTRRRATRLGYAFMSFQSIGVPLQVILHSFVDQRLVWFSLIYGDFDDNTLLLALTEIEAMRLPHIRHKGVSPMDMAFGSSGSFDEYFLSEEVQKALGIDLAKPHSGYSVEHQEQIRFQIDIHDDCFSVVKPVDSGLLRRLILCVLQQHSFYLNNEVDWSGILGDLTNMVERQTQRAPILLRSQPSRQYLTVRREGILSALKASLSSKLASNIIIYDSKAQWSRHPNLGYVGRETD